MVRATVRVRVRVVHIVIASLSSPFSDRPLCRRMVKP